MIQYFIYETDRCQELFSKLVGQGQNMAIIPIVTRFTLSHIDMGQKWDRDSKNDRELRMEIAAGCREREVYVIISAKSVVLIHFIILGEYRCLLI